MWTIVFWPLTDSVHDRMELTVGVENLKLVKLLQIIGSTFLCGDSKGCYGSCHPANPNCKTVSMPLMG